MSRSDEQNDDDSASLSRQLENVFDVDSEIDPTDTAFLVGLSGRHAGKLFRLPAGVSLIGRSSRALVTLDEKAVSHHHAELTLTAKGCVVTDLKSTNGSFLNDHPITSPQTLNAGDVLRFGNSTLGFLTDAEDEEQHTRALARVTHPTFGLNSNVALAQISRDSTGGLKQGLALASENGIEAPSANPTAALDNFLDKLDLSIVFLRRYWRHILATSLLSAGLGAATMIIKPPVSTAEFEILLRADETVSTAHHFATRSIDYFASAEKNFSNKALVRQTMKDLDLPTPEAAVRGTALGLTFKTAGVNIYRGSYSHPEAQFAKKFLAQHLKNYLEREIGKSIEVLSSEVNLLRTQYQDNEALLNKHEASLRDFKQEHLNSLPEVAQEQVSSRASLTTQKDALTAALTRASQQLALSRKQLASEDAIATTRVLQPLGHLSQSLF
jgi:hypothetical protein